MPAAVYLHCSTSGGKRRALSGLRLFFYSVRAILCKDCMLMPSLLRGGAHEEDMRES